MKRTLAYKYWERKLVILVHSKDAPSDDEWKVYCDDVRKWCQQIRGILVVSVGGGPNGVQRGELETALGIDTYKAKTAVVTLSRVARGIVTAISWFNPSIKAFSTIQIPAAMDYLDVPKKDHDAVTREINLLREALQIPPD